MTVTPSAPDHPDDEITEFADDVEVDSLVEGIDTEAPVLTEEDVD